MSVQQSMFGDEPRLDLSQWYTPPKLARMIVEWTLRSYATSDPRHWGQISDYLRILEPAAGRGALILDIPEQHSVVAYDVDQRNIDYLMTLSSSWASCPCTCEPRLRDFLSDPDPGHFDLSIMNPPYEHDQDLDFARRVVVDGVADRAVMLMRSVFRHGKKRWEKFWRHVNLNRQVDLVTRPKFGGDNTALSDFAVFDVTRRDVPLELGQVQKVEVERWII
jgi:predicted RNA methylase